MLREAKGKAMAVSKDRGCGKENTNCKPWLNQHQQKQRAKLR